MVSLLLHQPKYFVQMESLATEKEKEFHYKQVKIRTGHTRIVTPEYFRHPDGEDLSGKLRCTTKWAAIVGGFYGLISAVVLAKKRTYKEWSFLFIKPVVPAVGMAAVFTITTYFATNFRKKDDQLNYGLGGAAAGLVFGTALRSVPHTIIGVLGLSATAWMYKENIHQPIVGPMYRKNYSPFEARFLDFSFTPAKKGNWSKEKVPDQ